MPRRMFKPKITEISGVDHPAHMKPGWLMMKDASPETAALLARAEAIATGVEPTEGRNMPDPIAKELREAADPVVLKYIESLEKAVEDKPEPVAKADPEPTEAEVFAKALEELPEPVRKHLIAQQAEFAKAREDVEKLTDEKMTKAFAEQAEVFKNLPGVTGETFGPALRKVAEADEETYKKVYEVLKAADGALHEANLFGENGTSGTAAAAGSGQEAIQAYAKELQAKDPKLTEAQAITKAVEEKPELYTQHRREYTASLVPGKE